MASKVLQFGPIRHGQVLPPEAPPTDEELLANLEACRASLQQSWDDAIARGEHISGEVAEIVAHSLDTAQALITAYHD